MKICTFLLTLALPSFLQAAAPANDHFANAATLTGSYVSFSGTTVDATKEVGEPDVGNDYYFRYNAADNSVWYKWTSPGYGVASFAALFDSSSKEHYAEVYVGQGITSLTNVWISFASNEPQFTFNAGKGVTYYIRFVNDSGPSSAGSFTALIDLDTSGSDQSLFQTTTWTNNHFNQARILTGTKIKALAYPRSASREAGEPIETGLNTLWWKWTAPYDGKAIISTAGSDTYSKNSLTVGTGSRMSDYQFVRELWDEVGSLVLDAKKGRTYYISLGGRDPNSSYILSIDHTKDAGNSPGKGFKGKFLTLPIDILNHTQVKGVFTAKGITQFDLKYDTSRFIVDRGQVSGNGMKWTFAIHKKSFADAPMSGKFTVLALKNGKTVAKVTKTFRVW